MLRAIDEIRPTWVVGENVAGLATMVEAGVLTDLGGSPSLFDEGDDVHGYLLRETFTIERICSDLERLGYSVQPVLIPAAAVGAPTDGTESSSLLMQTPTAVMTCESPEKMRARAEKNGYKNGTKYGSLESQINYDPRFAGILPTPMAVDVHHATRVEELRAKGATMHSRANGDSRPNGLTDYLHFNGLLKTPSAMDPASERMTSKGISGTSGTLAQEIASGYVEKRGFMLPTPTARDEKNPSSPDGKRIARKMEQGYTIELNDLAAMRLLPTPTCNDSTNASIPVSQGRRNDSITKRIVTGEIPTEWTPTNDGPAFRLSPLFTEEMMGFPFLWTTLPFLRQGGGLNPLKAYGNAIVPQVMYRIFQAIEKA